MDLYNLNRREFILGGVALWAISPLSFPSIISPDKKGRLIISLLCNPKNCKATNQLKIFDLDKKISSSIPIEFDAHSFSQNPINNDLVIGLGKWKKYLGLYDINSKKRVNRHILTSDYEVFGGHGSFNSLGDLFYASAVRYSDKTYPRIKPGKGLIKVYKADSLKLVDEFDSFGLEPHESTFLDDQKTLVVINSGARSDQFKKNGGEDYYQSNISFINSLNKKLIHKIPLEIKKHYLSHLSKLRNGEIVAVGYKVGSKEKKYPWGVKITKDFKINEIKNFTKNYEGYCISTRLGNKSKFLSTLPQSKVVFIGDHQKEKIIGSIKIDGYPSGVSATLDEKYFVVNTGKSIFLIDIKENRIGERVFHDENFFLGSHSLVI